MTQVQSALKEFPDITLKAIPEDAQFDSRYPSGKPGYESISFHNYVTSIEQEDGPFDLIIIDGRARSACFKAALPKLAPDGCILLDNSNRARYQSVLQDPDLNIVRYKGLAPGLPYHDETSLVWNEGIQSDED